jgi:hypothetical protein
MLRFSCFAVHKEQQDISIHRAPAPYKGALLGEWCIYLHILQLFALIAQKFAMRPLRNAVCVRHCGQPGHNARPCPVLLAAAHLHACFSKACFSAMHTTAESVGQQGTHARTHRRAHTHTHTHARAHPRARSHTHTHTHTQTHAITHRGAHTDTDTRTNTHTHTHTHAHARTRCTGGADGLRQTFSVASNTPQLVKPCCCHGTVRYNLFYTDKIEIPRDRGLKIG